MREALSGYLGSCPRTDGAILIVSEITTNAIVHSGSKGEFFTVRAELFRDYLWLECEDRGGTWYSKPRDERPHGLDIIEALAGPDGWGTEDTTDGSRVVWVRLPW